MAFKRSTVRTRSAPYQRAQVKNLGPLHIHFHRRIFIDGVNIMSSWIYRKAVNLTR